MKAMW